MTIDNRIQVVLIDDDPHLRQALGQTLDLAGLKSFRCPKPKVSPRNWSVTGPAWWSAISACQAWTAWNC